jgi:hypothetical protein
VIARARSSRATAWHASRRARAAALAALLAACSGGAQAGSPEAALSSFARALREGDVETAYSLTSEDYRSRVSAEQFARWIREHESEIHEVADAMEHPVGPAEAEATIELGEHERVRMVRDRGGWRIATDVVDYYSQSTPRQALRTFVRAVRNRRWDVVFRLVPEADREGMTEETLRARGEGDGREEVERLAEGIRAALDADAPIEETGDHATIAWGDRFRAQLVREDGAWRIEDPD